MSTSFPGFYAGPAEVFELLWVRRDTLQVAHQNCAGRDFISEILIQGLHSIRSSPAIERHLAELSHLVENVAGGLNPLERPELLDLNDGVNPAEYGSGLALQSTIRQLGSGPVDHFNSEGSTLQTSEASLPNTVAH